MISVRTLCDLTAKKGSLDQRFTPSPTALEGMMGHQAELHVEDIPTLRNSVSLVNFKTSVCVAVRMVMIQI